MVYWKIRVTKKYQGDKKVLTIVCDWFTSFKIYLVIVEGVILFVTLDTKKYGNKLYNGNPV